MFVGGAKMNKRGFTLVEMLATITILGLVLGIASISVIHTIENSKTRSEKLFVDNLSKSIDAYLDWNGSSLIKDVNSLKKFEKCANYVGNECKNTYQVEAYLYKKSDGDLVGLRDLIELKLIDEQKFINPRNKKKCLEGDINPKIYVYRDSEFIFYYYIDLTGDNTTCGIEKNGVINTLPGALKEKVGLS